MLELAAGFTLLVLDFRNMFDEISRLKAREELEIHFPQLLCLFDRLHPLSGNVNYHMKPDGSWGFFLQKEGFAQGCPLAPLLSCLVLLRLVTNLQKELDACVHDPNMASFSFSCIDDTAAPACLLDTGFTFRHLAMHGPEHGLHLSHEKNHMLLSTDDAFSFSQLPQDLHNEIKWAADAFCNGEIDLQGVLLLDYPMGNPAFVSQQLDQCSSKFSHAISQLRECVASLATHLRLFTACVQQQIPF